MDLTSPLGKLYYTTPRTDDRPLQIGLTTKQIHFKHIATSIEDIHC